LWGLSPRKVKNQRGPKGAFVCAGNPKELKLVCVGGEIIQPFELAPGVGKEGGKKQKKGYRRGAQHRRIAVRSMN